MDDGFFADEEGRFEEVAADYYRWLSLGRIRRAIDDGRLTLNGRRSSRAALVKPGDMIALEGAVEEIPAATAPARALPVLFEDEHLIAVDKPAGVPVVPERGSREWVLMAMLLHHARTCPLCREGRFRIVHRLDMDTSGALVIAKTLEAARALSAAFGRGGVEKEYLALVRGAPAGESGAVDAPIAPSKRRRRAMAVSSTGRESRTEWRVSERFAGYTLVAVRPLTGRTHQIRVHLAHEGLPLAVDPMYGGAKALLLSDFKRGYRRKGEEKPLLARLSLHCLRLELAHPATGEKVSATAPIPGDFERALKALRKHGRKGH